MASGERGTTWTWASSVQRVCHGSRALAFAGLAAGLTGGAAGLAGASDAADGVGAPGATTVGATGSPVCFAGTGPGLAGCGAGAAGSAGAALSVVTGSPFVRNIVGFGATISGPAAAILAARRAAVGSPVWSTHGSMTLFSANAVFAVPDEAASFWILIDRPACEVGTVMGLAALPLRVDTGTTVSSNLSSIADKSWKVANWQDLAGSLIKRMISFPSLAAAV